MEQLLAFVRELDTKGALAPYLESNAGEFEFVRGTLLADAELVRHRALAGLDESEDAELLALARTIRDDRRLAFLYFHCCRLAFEFMGLYGDIGNWPSFEPVLPKRSGTFLLLVALSAVPRIQRIHQVLKVPAEVTRDTCGDIASRVSIGREFRGGELGVTLRCLGWLRLHARGELFQFGRLQFHPTILNEPIRAYRRLTDGEVLLLLEPGQRFTPEGYYDGADGKLHADAWLSDWREQGGRLTANRILASNGLAERTPVTIEVKQWQWVADASSVVLNTHIPRGSRISLLDWQSSIRRGFEFYRTLRSVAARPVACACKSWMFDPRLQELLPESSGLVSLQKRVAVFPLCSAGSRSGLYFIFGEDNVDLGTAPQDTSLRRAVIQHLGAGGALCGGGMMVFEDQLERFTT
jgi:hypothetical protein